MPTPDPLEMETPNQPIEMPAPKLAPEQGNVFVAPVELNTVPEISVVPCIEQNSMVSAV